MGNNFLKIHNQDKRIDNLGRMIFSANTLADLLINNKSINGLISDDQEEVKKYNKFSTTGKLILYEERSLEDYDLEMTNKWKTPLEYQNINIDNYILDKCLTEIEQQRVLKELKMYKERNLYSLLKHLIFLIDHFRKNNIVWGIGRGSSVSSYVLYLIGIHKVDSLKYNLHIEDFLR